MLCLFAFTCELSVDDEDTLSLSDGEMAVEEHSDNAFISSDGAVPTLHHDLSENEWKIGWSRWSVSRRRARLAQFIVNHLHMNNNAR